MSNFKIGDKVVCIGDFRRGSFEILNNIKDPIKGEIYTIRDIVPYFSSFGLRFEEIINPTLTYLDETGECHYNAEKFRKLDHQFAEDLCAQLIEDAKRETILN